MTKQDDSGGSISGKTSWATAIPDKQWAVYQDVIKRARESGLRFALGGAFAVATYTGRWRHTKDLDFYVLPPDRDAMVDALSDAGLKDYYDVLNYQRHWIYRGYQGDVIVDVIWAMANGRNVVDDIWLTNGPVIELCDEEVHMVPSEEMIWAKLYVFQKDRNDWTDICNIIYAVGSQLDWEHLLSRLGDDVPLLRGSLSVFSWLDPSRARELPRWLWKSVGLHKPEEVSTPELIRQRAAHLDTRPWFLPLLDDQDQT